jgi:hypothetical protein
LYQICRADPRPVEALNSTLSRKTGAVLVRALAKEPDERFGSCNELVEALAGALGENSYWTLPHAGSQTPAAVATAASVGPVAPVVKDSKEESSPEPPSYKLPALTLRRLATEEEDESQTPKRSKLGRKLLAVLLMGLAAATAVMFIARWNFGLFLPRQGVNPKTSPAAPPLPRDYTQENLPAPPAERANRKKLPENAKSAPVSPATVSAVEFLTEPPGAKITVDNRADTACQSPCTLPLPGGRHTLTAELEGFNLGRHIFTVPNETSILMNLSRSMGTLIVTSDPSGSQVLVDGKDYGPTPAHVPLTAGSHQLVLINGAQRHEETVVITNDAFETRSFRWQ